MDLLPTIECFCLPLLQVIGINVILSGDNAVVIALAARALPPRQQRAAILWGSAAAVVMRIILTLFAVELLTLPFLKLIGSVLLLWIGVKLLLSEEEKGEISTSSHLLTAIRIIVTADLVMSLDNVIAVAGATRGDLTLLILSLLISIPLIVFGATLLMGVMKRFPIIITLGAALLGWVAGEMAVSDSSIHGWVTSQLPVLERIVPAGGAILVVLIGLLLGRKRS